MEELGGGVVDFWCHGVRRLLSRCPSPALPFPPSTPLPFPAPFLLPFQAPLLLSSSASPPFCPPLRPSTTPSVSPWLCPCRVVMVAMQQERVRSSASSLHQRGGGRRGAAFWKEEKDSVGTRLMERMGWKEGKGLGKGGRGTAEMAVKGRFKADQRGIGAAATTGEAKQHLFARATTDLFNDLLTRLNSTHHPSSHDTDVDADADTSPSSSIVEPSPSTGEDSAEEDRSIGSDDLTPSACSRGRHWQAGVLADGAVLPLVGAVM